MDATGKLIRLRDLGKKRRLAPRCTTIAACINQVRRYRDYCKIRSQPTTNLNSTYVIHSRFERAEILQPGFAKYCDELKLGSADAHEEAKRIIETRDSGKMGERLALAIRLGRHTKKTSLVKHHQQQQQQEESSEGEDHDVCPLVPVHNYAMLQCAGGLCGENAIRFVYEDGCYYFRPIHPVVWIKDNLCHLRTIQELDQNVTLHSLKKIYAAFDLVVPKGAKAEFVSKLWAYLSYCACRIALSSLSASSSSSPKAYVSPLSPLTPISSPP